MLGTQKLEELIIDFHKKRTSPVLIIILLIYILNVNNHYRYFLHDSRDIRNELYISRRDYRTALRFNKKLLEHANVIGRTLTLFRGCSTLDSYKLLVIKQTASNTEVNESLTRIVDGVRKASSVIEVISVSNGTSIGGESLAIGYKGLNSLSQFSIVLLGEQNDILSALSLDGTESSDELHLISNYILRCCHGSEL